MSIGIVSSEDFQKELEKLVPSVKEAVIVEKPHRGRDEGDTNVPEVLREVIAETSVTHGRARALDVAKSWGISPASVSAYSKGATSTATYDQPKKSLTDVINRSKMRATRKASRSMMYALEQITPDKLESAKVRDLAGIAKDMSAIIKNMEPSHDTISDGTNSPQFVIFAPSFRDERSFQTIVASEE